MKRILLSFFASLLFLSAFHAQIYFRNLVYSPHSAYLEVMGNGRFYSLNYEYLFRDYGIKQGVRFGAGVFPNFFNVNKPLCMNGIIEYTGFWLSRNHHIEWGAGATYRYDTYTKNTIEKTFQIVPPNDTIPLTINHTLKNTTRGFIFTGRVGYRYQNPDGGLIVRVGWTPLFYVMNKEKIIFDDNIISNNKLPFSNRIMCFGASVGWNWW